MATTTTKRIADPVGTRTLVHPPNRCLRCDGVRRARYGLPQTGGKDIGPLPDTDPEEW